MLIRSLFIALLLCGLTACGSMASLNQYGEQVFIVDEEPLNQCEEIGKFLGRGGLQKYALNNLRNIVGERGGNRVYIRRAEVIGGLLVGGNDHTVYGTGFKCDNSEPQKTPSTDVEHATPPEQLHSVHTS